MRAQHDDPFERRARLQGRANFRITSRDPDDPEVTAALREWDWVARSLLSRGAIAPATRTLLEDSRRIVGELSRVLAGEEDGEGRAEGRIVLTASQAGRIQAVAAIFLCPRAAFVELLATAPWNLLGPGDPPDGRAVRGAGTALLADLGARSRASGAGGRISLQAENPRCLGVYERLGFAPMRPSDAPLSLVPPGEHGWSESVIRLARGAPLPGDARTPWLLLDPARVSLGAVTHARRGGAVGEADVASSSSASARASPGPVARWRARRQSGDAAPGRAPPP
jgi:hypothetical protein